MQNAEYTTNQIRDLSSKLEVAENSCTRASYTGPVAPDVVSTWWAVAPPPRRRSDIGAV